MTTSSVVRTWSAFKAVEVAFLAGSIAFLGIQSFLQTKALQAQERALIAQIDQNLTQQNNDINKLFIENPKLRAYFYDSASLPTDTDEKAQVETIAELYLDFIEQFANEHTQALPGMQPGGPFWTAWNNYFAKLFARSPSLCKRYADTKDWYTEKHFGPLVSANCQKNLSVQPPKTPNPSVNTAAAR